jgi:hypothetical protein
VWTHDFAGVRHAPCPLCRHPYRCLARLCRRAKNDSVALALDEVHTLTFRTPVSTVYVGNPTVADVTMIDARHAFVQGKGYGRTNVMALNRDNVMVFNTHITVTSNNGGGTVTLNRGASARDPELRRRPLRADADAGRQQGLRRHPWPADGASNCGPHRIRCGRCGHPKLISRISIVR